MRVVAGTLRGRRLEAPPDDRARPTPDRVREAAFNALGSLDAITDARVLDLYAGTGALGIEALSRGARHATFVERDRTMVGVLERNLAALGLADRATVLRQDAADALRAAAGTGEDWDLALLDPPYAFDGWAALLDQLPARLALIETDRPPEVPDGWHVLRQKRYGGTLVTVVEQSRPHRVAGGTP